MFIILHGDNLIASRQELQAKIEKATREKLEIFRFEGKILTLEELRTALESNSLFGTDRLVIIENLLSQVKGKNKNILINYLKTTSFNNHLVIWENKEIGKRDLTFKAEVHLFKVDPLIFKFLDNLRPKNEKNLLHELANLKKQEEAEMIFYMIIRQFRLLIMVKDNIIEGLAPWQTGKLKKQAEFFTVDQLKNIMRQLLEIDKNQKTSRDPYPLSSRLDLFILYL